MDLEALTSVGPDTAPVILHSYPNAVAMGYRGSSGQYSSDVADGKIDSWGIGRWGTGLIAGKTSDAVRSSIIMALASPLLVAITSSSFSAPAFMAIACAGVGGALYLLKTAEQEWKRDCEYLRGLHDL